MQGEENPGYIGLVDEGKPKEDPPPYERISHAQSNIYDDIDELGVSGIHGTQGIDHYQNSHMEQGYLGEGVYPNRQDLDDYVAPKNFPE